jgi:hypothetical protein
VPRLLAIGVVAGIFSAMFGVGGGIVVVPLLLLVASFRPHAAAATSIGAILLTASAGVVLYAARGHVEVAEALLVGIPGAVGALAGTRLQRALSGRALTLGFAGLLVVISAWLIFG